MCGEGTPPSPVSTKRAWRTTAAAGLLEDSLRNPQESLRNPQVTSVSAHPARCWTRPWPEPKEGGGLIGPPVHPPSLPRFFRKK